MPWINKATKSWNTLCLFTDTSCMVLICLFPKPCREKKCAATSELQTMPPSALQFWSYEWKRASLSHLSELQECITEWQMVKRGSLTDWSDMCSFGPQNRKQIVFIYLTALFKHLSFCFCPAHMKSLKPLVRCMTLLDNPKYLRSSFASRCRIHVVCNYHLHGLLLYFLNKCVQESESRASHRGHMGSPSGTLQPSSPGAPGIWWVSGSCKNYMDCFYLSFQLPHKCKYTAI